MPLTEEEVAALRAAPAGNAEQARLVDAVRGGPLLVVGGVPPDGRDLDLLVPDEDLPPLAAALAAAGFEARGVEWVRFADLRALAVDLIPASDWGLPDGERRRLFAHAREVPGYERLRRPAPPDHLLLLARRALGVREPLADKHRGRIARTLDEDPSAWLTAAARAPAWGVARDLEALRTAYDTGRAARRRRLARRHRRGAVVALSGIDGSGKSTQAEVLAQALRELGHDATVQWSRITYDPALKAIGAVPKRLLAVVPGRDGAPPPAAADEEASPAPEDRAAVALRERLPVLDHLWILTVVVVHALGQRRALGPHLGAGRVVVRDRYVLDATVQLVEVYGRRRDVRPQAWVLRRLCPAPAAAFWLDVDPAEAYRRKPEEYTAEELAAHRDRYERAHRALGAGRVDASRPRDEVAAVIGRAVWRALA